MPVSNVQISEERLVAQHILSQMETGRLLPGDRPPAERKLSADLSVSRAHVRAAIQRLEFYGIVKTFPQSGTILTDHKASVLQNQLRNILDIHSFDFYSLVQVRILLEREAIRLCARERTEEDIQVMQDALEDFKAHMLTDLRDEKDFAFHLSIARASHNPVLASLLLTITPDVLKYYRNLGACTIPVELVCEEHEKMLRCIIQQDENAAEECIKSHFKAISSFSDSYRSNSIPRTHI